MVVKSNGVDIEYSNNLVFGPLSSDSLLWKIANNFVPSLLMSKPWRCIFAFPKTSIFPALLPFCKASESKLEVWLSEKEHVETSKGELSSKPNNLSWSAPSVSATRPTNNFIPSLENFRP